jgi:TRAP-type C4-dicarboxylate transport system permease small subunit
MTFGLTLLQTEGGHELPAPDWAFGVIAFALLVAMLMITLAIGKGRPHS